MTKPKSQKGRLLRVALPWVGSLAFVAYLVVTSDLAQIGAAIRQAPLVAIAAVAVVSVVASYLWDSFCLTLLFRRFNAPVGFGEVAPMKGASYFLNVVNYGVAMGGMALYLRRTRRVPFLEGASTLLFLNAVDVLALAVLVGLGLASGGAHLTGETREGLTIAVAVIAFVIAGSWVYWNGRFDFFVFGRLRRLRIFHAFARARLVDWGWLVGVRLGLVGIYVLTMWFFLQLFAIRVPLVAMLALHPIVMLVWTVPISIAGIGTTQVAMRYLYGPFTENAAVLGLEGTHAVVDACSTTMIFTTLAVRLAVGYAALRRVSDAYLAGPTDEEQAEVDADKAAS